MKDEKMCESAYMAANHSRMGPGLHGAAIIDRTSGTTHIWMARGDCSVSVVDELQRQLVKSGRLCRPASCDPPAGISSFTTSGLSLIAAGVQAILSGFGRTQ